MKKPLTTSETVRPGGELPSGFFMTPLGRTPLKEGSAMKKVFVGLAVAVALLVPGIAQADGGPGNDVIYGSAKNDNLTGGTGNDIIYSGLGADSVRGGPGFDICYVSAPDAVSGCEVTK